MKIFVIYNQQRKFSLNCQYLRLLVIKEVLILPFKYNKVWEKILGCIKDKMKFLKIIITLIHLIDKNLNSILLNLKINIQ